VQPKKGWCSRRVDEKVCWGCKIEAEQRGAGRRRSGGEAEAKRRGEGFRGIGLGSREKGLVRLEAGRRRRSGTKLSEE
jgi:hypothetical protein